MSRKRINTFEDLLLRTKKVGDCWEWQDHCCQRGYGLVYHKGTQYRVHRLALYLNGDLSWQELHNSENVVMHKCDNPPCFNPAHLFSGTQSDNIRDRTLKGRSARHLENRDENGRFK